MFRKGQLNSFLWSGLLAGSIIALTASIAHSQGFRPEFQDPGWLITWYAVSLLLGVSAGLLGGFLISLIPIRLTSIVSAVAGGVFGILGYCLQVCLLLLTVFKSNPSSF